MNAGNKKQNKPKDFLKNFENEPIYFKELVSKM